MKKLSIALALILCLVLCVFCFASCKKKTNTSTTAATEPAPATADSTTDVPPSTTEFPAHEHTPATEYTIDVEPTCGAAGSKSYHCTECDEIIPGTSVPIPADPSQHVVNDWVTVDATVIADGSKTGTCTKCGQTVEEPIVFVPSVYDSSNAGNAWKIKKNIMETLDGDHFYPTDENPNGQAYYFEVDLLWNETIKNNWVDGDGMRIELVNADSTRDNLFLFVPKDDKWNSSDAKASGGFDYGWIAKHTIVYGPMGVDGTGTNAENFPNIGEYGWHRIGVKVYQEAAIKGDGVTYSMVTTLYLDGVKAWEINFVEEGDKTFQKWLDRSIMLFTATNNEGVLEYSDPSAELALDFSAYHTDEMEGVFMIWGDVVSTVVDPDFAPDDVVPVLAPEPATYTLPNEAEIPAAIYFKDPTSGHDHVWTGPVDIVKQATLLEDGVKTEHCSVCNEPREVPYSYEPDVQKFTDATKNSYNPNIAKVSDIRGDEHFYTAGNDLLVEFSILWTEEIQNLNVEKKPYMDTRFTQTSNPDSTNKNIIYWSMSNNCPGSDCKFAGGFEWGGIDQNEPDNPYPKFTASVWDADKNDYVTGDKITEFPNIGGANKGDGIPQGEDRYGWHRVSIRYRQEVSNVDAVKAGSAAEYKLSLWVYIDGVLVVHSYATDFVYKPGESGEKDYKLFTAASDGNGGIAYTDSGDNLYLSGAYFHYKQMASGKVAYFAIADYSATIGSEFVQNVAQVNYPVAAKLEVEDGVFVPSTLWYTKPCAEHTWDGEFTVIEESTLLNDGLKVEHCSVCGMSHEVAVEAAPVITDSQNIAASKYADNGNKDVAALKSVADIRGDKSFAPTEEDADGNDLWFEYSFLWNDSLQYRDASTYLAEMRLFGFRSADYSKYRGFYYLYFLNDDGKGGAFNTSDDCPFKGHIDYSTYKTGWSDAEAYKCADDLSSLGNCLNGELIGQYMAGWAYCHPGGVTRQSSPYLYDAEKQTLGGWHRLGFRYHQEVESVSGSTVTYAGYTELYIDGVLCWRVHTNFKADHKDSLTKNGLLLWTATAEDGVITGYTNNDTMLVGMRIDRLDTSSQSVYVGIDDVQWNCGDGFVRNVIRVENPKPVKITLPDGNEYDGAMYYTYPHAHVWDEDYEVTEEATLLEDGVKIDHCTICGETRETAVADVPYVISSNMNSTARTAYNTANGVDWLNHPDLGSGIMIKKSINDIKAADQHYYPTEGNDQGNDLLVEVSYLWNDTCSVYSWQTLTFAHVDGYDVFNCGANVSPKVRNDYTYEFITPTPAEIEADESVKTPSIGGYGWHRLGFRVHQEAEIVADAVKYTYVASAYVDGTLVLSFDMTDYVLRRSSTSTVTALLYTAKIEEGNLVYFDIGENPDSIYKTSYAILMFEEFFNKTGAYCVFTDLSMTCGHSFVQDVVKVADPTDATFEIAEGVEVSGKIWYRFAD